MEPGEAWELARLRTEIIDLRQRSKWSAKEGIPPEFLSHYEPDEPFARPRLNDGLSDIF